MASGRTPLGTMALGTARRPGNASADQVEAMLDRMSELRQEAADAQTTSAELQEANAILMERLEEFQNVHESNVTTGEFGTHTTLAHTTLAHQFRKLGWFLPLLAQPHLTSILRSMHPADSYSRFDEQRREGSHVEPAHRRRTLCIRCPTRRTPTMHPMTLPIHFLMISS
jgi:hypothetical protein